MEALLYDMARLLIAQEERREILRAEMFNEEKLERVNRTIRICISALKARV